MVYSWYILTRDNYVGYVSTSIRRPFDCNSTARRPTDYLRYDRTLANSTYMTVNYVSDYSSISTDAPPFAELLATPLIRFNAFTGP